jgi:hypothetical protein
MSPSICALIQAIPPLLPLFLSSFVITLVQSSSASTLPEARLLPSRILPEA